MHHGGCMLKWYWAGMLVIPFSLTACGGSAPIKEDTAANTGNNDFAYEQARAQQNQAQRQQQLRQKLAAQQQYRQTYSPPNQQQLAAQQRQRQQQAQQRQRQQQLAAQQHQRQQQTNQQRQQQLAAQQRQRQQQLAAQQRQRQAANQLALSRSNRSAPTQRRHTPPPRPAPKTLAYNHVPASSGVRPYQASAKIYRGSGRNNRLPDNVATKLRLRGLSSSRMSAYARNVRGGQALLTANADRAFTPASTMKLVTTYAALGMLGPNYRWPTEIYTTGQVINGTLNGDVIIKGYGDPDFREANLRTMLQQLRAQGIHTIRGNLLADTTFFKLGNRDPGAFDGKPHKAYNALPEALLYNERGSCYTFKNLKGKIQRVCPLPTNRKARAAVNTNIFGGFWKIWTGEMGGKMHGQFYQRPKPYNARLVYRHHSKPLSHVIKRVNKKSNNVMARQLLLSIAAKQKGAPGTERKGAQAIGQWLSGRGLHFPELRIENGSGLSRVAKVSARHLGEMLVDAYNSPYRNHFMQSLAVLGVDGTVRNRLKKSPARGRGKFKTGTLRNVRAIAGYVQAADGQTYVLSILHNDPKARSKARSAHDELIEWTFNAGRSNFVQR